MKRRWLEEEEKAFSGWDFSYLEGRWKEGDLPWDYKEIILEYLEDDLKLLDMGTGGGEFLLTLNHPYHLTSVTEGYKSNYELCKENLEGLGITVQFVEDDHLNFPDESFDIIINRHESFDVEEVLRCLKPGGYFITQQIAGDNNHALAKKVLGDFEPEYAHINLHYFEDVLKEFEILRLEEAYTTLQFFDVGAFVFFAKVIEWEFPGFSASTHDEKLQELHKEVEANGFIESTQHYILSICRKR